MTSPRVLISRAALRAFAERWFLLGFRLSGRGFHGETYDDHKYPALRQLLLAEFTRVWDREHQEKP